MSETYSKHDAYTDADAWKEAVLDRLMAETGATPEEAGEIGALLDIRPATKAEDLRYRAVMARAYLVIPAWLHGRGVETVNQTARTIMAVKPDPAWVAWED